MGSDETKKLIRSNSSHKEYGTLSSKAAKENGHTTHTKSKDVDDEHENPVSIWKLFRFSTNLDVCLMIFGSIFAAINGAGMPVMALVYGSMTDTFLGEAPVETDVLRANDSIFISNATYQQEQDNNTSSSFEETMTGFALYYVYIGIMVFFASLLQIFCWMMSGERQTHSIRQEFFYQVLRLDISWFDKHQNGELTTRLSDDLERIREGIGDKFSLLIQFLATFAAGFLVGFVKGWKLTLVIMSLSPLLALSSAFVGKLIATSAIREQKKYAIAGGVAEEVLGNIRTVTAFNGQEREVKRYSKGLAEGINIALRKYIFVSLGVGATSFTIYASYSLAFWYGSILIMQGEMTAGDVFSVLFAVMLGSQSLGNAIPQLTSVATALGSAQTIFNVIDKKPKIDPYSKEGLKPKSFSANIEFHNVDFFYPSRKTVQVLKNFSLSVKEGQKVALCGPSGSGKSTIVNLMLRFYDPAKGKVVLGDCDLKSLNVNWLRSKIGLVSQEPVLFSETIARNIEYGQENVTFPDVVNAAKMANAHNFIMKLPQGYETLVGERGAQLSGGQKQRIAIARALVRDPKILLLDEATSALDAESEAAVQEAINKAQEGRTTIVVAHRLSTIRSADLICAMENGEIKEQGTHQELMEKRSLYYNLVTSQILGDDDDVCSSEGGHPDELDRVHSLNRKWSSVKSDIHKNHRKISKLEDDVKEEKVVVPSGFQILKECKTEWKEIVIGLVFSVIFGMILPSYAVFYSEIFKAFTLPEEEMKKAAFFWSMMFLVLAAITCLTNILRTFGLATAGEKLTMRLRQQVFTNILRQGIAWFDVPQHSSGKISTRLATDVPLIKSAAGVRIATVLSGAVTLISGLIIAFIFGWKLALALVIVVPILLITGAAQMKILKGNQIRDVKLMANAGNVASEAIENIKTVQSLTLEEVFFERYLNHLLLPFIENKKNSKIYALTFAFSQVVMFFTYAAAFRLGAYFVVLGDMQAVDVYRVFFAMAFTAVAVGQMTSYLPDYSKARLSAGLVFNLMKIVPNIDSGSKGGIKPIIEGKLDFINIHFRYTNRKDVLVLNGVNLTIQPGQTLALVGTSGCGKSTLIALLERFYDPENGQITVDGFDIKTINLKYLRSQMALVSQEPVLFNCSIKDNIIYGIEDQVSLPEVEMASRMANIHDFIMKLPQGYQTPVGERGTQLSGGQKQRIAIARALVRNPKILLLDEATSALDTENELVVQEALDVARKGRTCIIIAHRLSTIQTADIIAVMDNGKVVETGTHQDLISRKGIYYKLIKQQINS